MYAQTFPICSKFQLIIVLTLIHDGHDEHCTAWWRTAKAVGGSLVFIKYILTAMSN